MKGTISCAEASVVSSRTLWQATWGRVIRWLELHRQRQQLASLSDAMLHDLDLSRADTHQESERHFWDDPLCK
ncbi:DUF1127 domain-containing protein [Pseudomonas fulva]|uniref:DUF1127 domain-containing protein n=1 Tax=Pseudomonas fulva TaxID=47880 RepID=UPI0015E31DF9|nr:DUF1127 domain-containing protein [Pseudomonas fulva]MBA1218812.1 DUF1127 domain-containing protein [Pseudomonas fulva]